MPNLKPTTRAEREALKHHSASEMLLPAPYYWQTILRLIADVERLERIRHVAHCVIECDLDMNDLKFWLPKLEEALNVDED